MQVKKHTMNCPPTALPLSETTTTITREVVMASRISNSTKTTYAVHLKQIYKWTESEHPELMGPDGLIRLEDFSDRHFQDFLLSRKSTKDTDCLLSISTLRQFRSALKDHYRERGMRSQRHLQVGLQRSIRV